MRAKQLVASTALGPMSLSYPANDLFLRSVAERVALNARDAGITIQPTPGGNGNLRLHGMADRIDGRRRRTATHGGAIGRGRSRQAAGFHQAGNSVPVRAIAYWTSIASFRWFTCGRPTASRREFTSSHPTADTFALHLEDAWVTDRELSNQGLPEYHGAPWSWRCGLSRRWFRRWSRNRSSAGMRSARPRIVSQYAARDGSARRGCGAAREGSGRLGSRAASGGEFQLAKPTRRNIISQAQALAQEQSLDFLELVGPDAAIISSAEWPARFGYKEDWLAQPVDWKSQGVS